MSVGMEDEEFKFAIDETVFVGELEAVVCGVAFFKNMPDSYQLQYIDATGCKVETWFAEHLISKPTRH